MSNKIDHEKHLEEWQDERPKYQEKEGFTKDGPIDWEKWDTQKPKILFLLKEAHGGGSPKDAKGRFVHNVLNWKYALTELHKDINAEMNLPSNEIYSTYEEQIKEIAFVEVKKWDEDNKESIESEIVKYAEMDKKFLKRQIELIDPHIILCGYTFASYKIIYDNDPMITHIAHKWLPELDIDANAWAHGNRMVIAFYHPSNPKSPEGWFNLLCGLMKADNRGNLFEKFDWA